MCAYERAIRRPDAQTSATACACTGPNVRNWLPAFMRSAAAKEGHRGGIVSLARGRTQGRGMRRGLRASVCNPPSGGTSSRHLKPPYPCGLDRRSSSQIHTNRSRLMQPLPRFPLCPNPREPRPSEYHLTGKNIDNVPFPTSIMTQIKRQEQQFTPAPGSNRVSRSPSSPIHFERPIPERAAETVCD